MGHRYSIPWILVCGFNFAKFYNWQFAHIIFNWFKCFRLTKLPSSYYLKPVGTLYKVDNDYPLCPEKRAVSSDMLSKYCKEIVDEYEIKVGSVKS